MSSVKRFSPAAKPPETLKQRMLRLVLAVGKRARVRFAVGGGLAVAARGFRRDTMDVDAFFHAEDRLRVLRALQQVAGDDYRVESFAPSHWIAQPRGADPDERVDLLFATADPEESAIEMATEAVCAGVKAPTFTTEWLVVCKFLAERDDAKDALDIWALHQRGAFDPKDVSRRLRQMGLGEDARRFPAFLERMKNLKKG